MPTSFRRTQIAIKIAKFLTKLLRHKFQICTHRGILVNGYTVALYFGQMKYYRSFFKNTESTKQLRANHVFDAKKD